MRYIALDKSAIEVVVQEKRYQSVDYLEGQRLVEVFCGHEYDANLPFLQLVKKDSGLFFLSSSSFEKCFLVIDLEQFDGFQKISKTQSLTVLQKVFRACLKNWTSKPFSRTERVVDDLLVVFPWSYSNADGSRAIIDRRPDAKRQEKRKTKHLLLFSFCSREVEKPSAYTVFKRFIEECAGVECDRGENESEDVDTPFKVSPVSAGFVPIDSRQNLETWHSKLTEKQKQIAFSELHGPERIEGPAGTGKTLSLVLRGINLIEKARAELKSLKLIFITHSNSTKENITSIFEANEIISAKLANSGVELHITTLQEWCLQELGNKIESTEIIDKDASDSKDYQRMLIEEVYVDIKKSLSSGKSYLSNSFLDFLLKSGEQSDYLNHVLQHEISEVIKGRSQQNIDNYKRIPFDQHALPVSNDSDKDFVFSVYNAYQHSLQDAGMFDTDDIVLSALNQLDTPIWRRRVEKDGFDVALVDETHLFNLNELSVLHHLLKSKSRTSVIYTVDRSQSIANSSLSYSELKNLLIAGDQRETSLSSVFRSSPEILALSCEVLASGANVFTALENPLSDAHSTLTYEEESKCSSPELVKYASDEEMISGAFEKVGVLSKKLGCSKSKIAIVATTDELVVGLKRYAEKDNKAHEVIERRADVNAVRNAEKSGGYIVAGIDYIGGLEFEGVVLCGVDKGRVPPADSVSTDSRHFLRHAAYNRLYVAMSRAKYGLFILENSSRGSSPILETALEKGLIKSGE